MKENALLTKIRDTLAIDAAKAVEAGSRLTGHQGTSITGKAAISMSPTVLADLARQIKKTTFAVCGTNGKTTVNNLLCSMLEAEGNKVVCNRLGANMLNGIAGAYVSAAGAGGHLDADYACLEVDEASAARVFPHVQPDFLILTNLFRDQLDRYGEIDITVNLLKEAIQEVPGMKLIVNADDPFSVYLAMQTGNPAVYYGIPEKITGHGDFGESQIAETAETEEIRESGFCKICGAPLLYDFYHFSQIGMYRCSSCSFRRPAARYEAKNVQLSDGVSFEAEGCRIRSGLSGEYSVYNLLAVWSALREEKNAMLLSGAETEKRPEGNLTAEKFNEVLDHYHTQFGRNEHFRVNGREVILNLAKNPAGFNQNIEAMLEDRDPKRLVIVINDNDQDGTDVSWLWDVDFDRIRDESVKSVIVSGIRARDMGLRLKYVEIDAEVTGTPEEAIEKQLAAGEEKVYVLVNYTALFPIHQYLLKKSDKGKK